jgi:hypothetical protein
MIKIYTVTFIDCACYGTEGIINFRDEMHGEVRMEKVSERDINLRICWGVLDDV